MSSRLDVKKTYKLYIGGKFPRSESGRYLPARSMAGEHLDNYSHASRKDFRDAVVAARAAEAGWSKATAYNRGQILYRAAEILQNRHSELVGELVRSTGATTAAAKREVTLAIDRLVYFAGWTDKYQQVFGSVNPVASSHFNFTTPEPVGVVTIIAPDEPALVALVSLIAPVILSGSTAVVVASEKFPLPAVTFAEILATSDLPGGVVNVLTGKRVELASHIAAHMDVNAIVDGSGDVAQGGILQGGSAINLKRYANRALTTKDWFTAKGEDAYAILDTVEYKTAWHPIGL
jgi:acyl-CoA reductase-like NAD-dependent aldehyde dehydrogenase